MVEVVAALIWRGDRFMICQRPAYKARGLLWEFVGGKVEPGETRPQALARECMEELGVQIEVGDLFMDLTHVYPDITLPYGQEPQKLEHADIRFIPVSEAGGYSFCPADAPILERIRELYGEKQA